MALDYIVEISFIDPMGINPDIQEVGLAYFDEGRTFYIRPDVLKWMEENIGKFKTNWNVCFNGIFQCVFLFDEEEHAILFKLTWE